MRARVTRLIYFMLETPFVCLQIDYSMGILSCQEKKLDVKHIIKMVGVVGIEPTATVL